MESACIPEVHLSSHAERLSMVLATWSEGYAKDDAFTGDGNRVEAEIMDLCAMLDKPSDPPDLLYRGQGVADGEMADLLSHGQVVVAPTKRLVSSWTSNRDVAMAFAADAAEDNFCSIVIAMPSRQLHVVANLNQYVAGAGEDEFLAVSVPLHVELRSVMAAWRYDPESQQTIRLELSARTPPQSEEDQS